MIYFMCIMYLFAHNGMNHDSTAGAAVHSAINPVIAVLLVSVIVVVLLAGAVHLLHRFSAVPIPVNDKEQE